MKRKKVESAAKGRNDKLDDIKVKIFGEYLGGFDN